MGLIIMKTDGRIAIRSPHNFNSLPTRLSSGLKIQTDQDCAAGLDIAQKMREDAKDVSRLMNEHNDLLSALRSADDALHSVSDVLDEMRLLTELGCVGNCTKEKMATHIARYEEIKSEIDRIVGSNNEGVQLFCSGNTATQEGRPSIHFGDDGDVEDAYCIEAIDSTAAGLGIANSSIATPEQAHEAHTAILAAIIKVNEARSRFGTAQVDFTQA